MNNKAVILEALGRAERLTVAGKFGDVAAILADVLGLIKFQHKPGEPAIPGVHHNTRAGFMVIGCRGILPDGELGPDDPKSMPAAGRPRRRPAEFQAPTVKKSVECQGCGESVDGEACPQCGLVVNSDPRAFYDVEPINPDSFPGSDAGTQNDMPPNK